MVDWFVRQLSARFLVKSLVVEAECQWLCDVWLIIFKYKWFTFFQVFIFHETDRPTICWNNSICLLNMLPPLLFLLLSDVCPLAMSGTRAPKIVWFTRMTKGELRHQSMNYSYDSVQPFPHSLHDNIFHCRPTNLRLHPALALTYKGGRAKDRAEPTQSHTNTDCCCRHDSAHRQSK